MTPLTKESIEAASSTAQAAAPRPVAPAATHLRSDAVSLEIPVRVHGSRITDVVMGVTPHTEPFEEQTTTMIVFSQGGVVKMSTPVTNGQMMVLTNLKTRQDVICRVLKVRNNPNLQAYVEIEFTHPQPGYWGVFFASDGPEFAPKTASTAQSLHLEPEAQQKTSPEMSRPFASSPSAPSSMPVRPPAASPVSPVATMPAPSSAAKSPVPPVYTPQSGKPESAFISIGSQEEVQVSATSTLNAKKAPLLEIVKDNRPAAVPANPPASVTSNVTSNMASSVAEVAPKKIAPVDFAPAAAEPVAPVSAGLSIAELQGDTQPAPAISAAVAGAVEAEDLPHVDASAESSPTSSRSTFGTFGSASAAPAREMFGSALAATAAPSAPSGTESPKNWFLIAACATVAAVVAAGGTMYFYRTPAGSANNSSAAVSASASSATPNANSNVSPQGAQNGQNAYVPPAAQPNSEVSAAPSNSRANTAKASRAVVTDHTDAATVAAAPNVTATMMAGTLSAHPKASQRAGASQAVAPSLDAGMGSPNMGGALPGMPASSSALPPPPDAPARVGGALREPKLISTTAPVYPLAARQASIDGDVVIHAVIDKSGNVAHADVVSGPAMLRQSALNAILRWKYAPSMLDGQPVSVDTTVTIKFRR